MRSSLLIDGFTASGARELLWRAILKAPPEAVHDAVKFACQHPAVRRSAFRMAADMPAGYRRSPTLATFEAQPEAVAQYTVSFLHSRDRDALALASRTCCVCARAPAAVGHVTVPVQGPTVLPGVPLEHTTALTVTKQDVGLDLVRFPRGGALLSSLSVRGLHLQNVRA